MPASMSDLSRLRRILIIDDNPAIHEDFRKIFGTISGAGGPGSRIDLERLEAGIFGNQLQARPNLDLAISSAFQGQEGVRLLGAALEERRPYAVIFVDMRMP